MEDPAEGPVRPESFGRVPPPFNPESRARKLHPFLSAMVMGYNLGRVVEYPCPRGKAPGGGGLSPGRSCPETVTMKIDPSWTVGKITALFSGSIPLFQKYGLHVPSAGGEKLENACRQRGLPLDSMLGELEELISGTPNKGPREKDWTREPPEELMDYIIRTHHVFTRLKLDEAERVLASLSKEKGLIPEFDLIRNLFIRLDHELREHLAEEEESVFPFLRAAEKDPRGAERDWKGPRGRGNFRASARKVLLEHGMMDCEFKEIEKLICLFNIGNPGRQTFRRLAQVFQELKEDNKQHVHLESDILLKGVLRPVEE
jgi:regulator of cell morphogenesis and NO signaling